MQCKLVARGDRLSSSPRVFVADRSWSTRKNMRARPFASITLGRLFRGFFSNTVNVNARRTHVRKKFRWRHPSTNVCRYKVQEDDSAMPYVNREMDTVRFYSPNTHLKRHPIKHVVFRFAPTEPLAEDVRKRLAALPFTTTYEEEQRGESLIASITCTLSQEPIVRRILDDLDITIIPVD